MKKCVKCKQIKKLNLFYKQIKNNDGYKNECKECTKNSVKNLSTYLNKRKYNGFKWRYKI